MKANAGPIMRYHGAKYRIASWIQSFFPVHDTYVEPFGGAAGVLLQKPRSKVEVYNDLDSEIVTVFRIIQNPILVEELKRVLAVTPYSRKEFELSYEPSLDPVEQARRVLVRAHMGFGSAGATKMTTGFRMDSARRYGTAADLWREYPLQIRDFCDRLQGVIIENKNALDVIDNHDREDTLFFVDPPYVQDTRKSGRAYKHEMSNDDHETLLRKLETLDGLVVLSGYDHEMYNDYLEGWEKHSTRARASGGRGTALRIENVWLNPACMAARERFQMCLLEGSTNAL